MGIEYNTEDNDDMLEENYMTVHVKMINEKKISVKCHRNMTAAVISDEVEKIIDPAGHDSPGAQRENAK